MHPRVFRLKLLLLTLLLANPVRTEADRLPPASRLTLERIHGTEEFKGKGFELRWLEDGDDSHREKHIRDSYRHTVGTYR